jgi:hypothetical protein
MPRSRLDIDKMIRSNARLVLETKIVLELQKSKEVEEKKGVMLPSSSKVS